MALAASLALACGATGERSDVPVTTASTTSASVGGSRPMGSAGGSSGGAGGATVGAGGSAGAAGSSPATQCEGSYGPPVATPVAEAALVEASGLAVSRRNPGVLYAHNDSGDSARVFALGTDGAALGNFSLPGVTAVDFEDIATAACPDASGPCVWIADTGNNGLDRTDQAIYAAPEPEVSGSSPLPKKTQAARVWRFPLVLPKGVVVDVEALAVSPAGDALYLFEKVDADVARVLGAKGPFADGSPVALDVVGTLASPGVPIAKGRMITAADLHPSGTRLALRVYTGVYEYRFSAGQFPAQLDAAERVQVALGPLSEPQGESVAYDAAGTGLFTLSEDPKGLVTQPLHHFPCLTP